MLEVHTPLVSVKSLYDNLNAENLVILDATIPKVAVNSNSSMVEKRRIPKAIFFDLKNIFSHQNADFPNTVPAEEHFQLEAQKLGINNKSCIIVYDDLGVYSSPRVRWMFKLMGFNNIAVLDGGLPAWERAEFPTETPKEQVIEKGNFKAKFQKKIFKTVDDVLASIEDETTQVIDARSNGRFYATSPEPRKDLRGGHIPNSINLPYTELLENDIFKPVDIIAQYFNELDIQNKKLIFSCGSGITACILDLAAEMIGYNHRGVYDGSWTEWASLLHLPIEK